MSTSAYILAIGPFSNEIKDCLYYPSDYYDMVPDGATVTSRFFCTETKDSSNSVARYFGLESVADFARLEITTDIKQINEIKYIRDLEFYEDIDDEISKMCRLHEKGFRFIFMPDF